MTQKHYETTRVYHCPEPKFEHETIGYVNTDFQERKTYVNNFDQGVEVVFRNGDRFHLPSRVDHRFNAEKELIIYHEVTLSDAVLRHEASQVWGADKVAAVSSGFSPGSSRDEPSNDKYNRLKRLPIGTGASLVKSARVVQKELDQLGDAVYVPSMDILIVIGGNSDALHPYSEEAIFKKQREMTNGNESSFFFEVDIIDNNDKIGSRFMNHLGVIYPVWAKKNDKLEDGIYLRKPIHSEGGFPRRGGYSEMFLISDEDFKMETLEEKYGLYKTYDDAVARGNPDHYLEKMAAETKLKEALFKLEKLEAEKIKVGRDREKEEAQELKLKVERENQAHVRKADENERKRRNLIEFLKIIPTLILGIISSVTAFKAAFG